MHRRRGLYIVRQPRREAHLLRLHRSSNKAASLTVALKKHYGSVKLYYSKDKLPTRDTVLGYTEVYPSGAAQFSSDDPPVLTATITLSDFDEHTLCTGSA